MGVRGEGWRWGRGSEGGGQVGGLPGPERPGALRGDQPPLLRWTFQQIIGGGWVHSGGPPPCQGPGAGGAGGLRDWEGTGWRLGRCAEVTREGSGPVPGRPPSTGGQLGQDAEQEPPRAPGQKPQDGCSPGEGRGQGRLQHLPPESWGPASGPPGGGVRGGSASCAPRVTSETRRDRQTDGRQITYSTIRIINQ